MASVIFSLFCVATGSLLLVVVQSNTVEINQGSVEGTTLVARNGKIFNAFYGIPYAKAPNGNLRFQPPIPAAGWNGTFDATRTPPVCPQVVENTDNYTGSEDCLYVNLYTPQNATPGSNFPVIVYFFGGQFKYGNPTKEGPEYYMSRDIILVMVSYRIGVFGFLSTGDSVIPGNMGLKDQTLSMQWVRNNIYKFGGDPNRITLQGHSSGAVCAHLHTLSPLSKGLFNRVILQSGLGTCPHLFIDKDTAKGLTYELARKVNCAFNTSKELLSCLLAKDGEDLVRTSETLRIWQKEPNYGFRPTVEDKDVENAFLTEISIHAPYQSTEPSWLIGMTSGEGASYVSVYFASPELFRDITTLSPSLILPIIAAFLWNTKPAHVNYIAHTIMTRSFDDEGISLATDTALVDLLTGAYHGMSVLNEVQKYTGVKYVYLYDYRANWNNQDSRYEKFLGVGHADEMPLLFKNPSDERSSQLLTEDDYAFGDEIITRWVNFAYTGNPNEPFPINTTVFGSWIPMTSSRIEFLRLRRNGSMEADYFRRKYEFWNKLPVFSKYR